MRKIRSLFQTLLDATAWKVIFLLPAHSRLAEKYGVGPTIFHRFVSKELNAFKESSVEMKRTKTVHRTEYESI